MSKLVYLNRGTMTVHSSEEKDLKEFFRLIDVIGGVLDEWNFYVDEPEFNSFNKEENRHIMTIPFWSESWSMEFEIFLRRFWHYVCETDPDWDVWDTAIFARKEMKKLIDKIDLIEFDYHELKFATQTLCHFNAEIEGQACQISGNDVPATLENVKESGLLDLGVFRTDAEGIRGLSMESESFSPEAYMLADLSDKDVDKLLEALHLSHPVFWRNADSFIDEYRDEISNFLWNNIQDHMFSLKDFEFVPKKVRENLSTLQKKFLKKDFKGDLWGRFENLMGDVWIEMEDLDSGYSLKDGPEGLWKAFGSLILEDLC